MDTSEQQDVSESLLKALLYGAPSVYFVVIMGVSLTIFEDILLLIAFGTAIVGSVFAYVMLKKKFENQYGVRL
ncbi:hypothetical protein E6P09_10510 [Haloferax mediterranei ATCC 33500]|uniref:Uncharacterized protein n=1 Tax=Haloferax mediterranei (strain ATCC 33500 / DSM 1411 / JCM 8866 / NBRC 14739 / NCIMB 2177 / R-4) TaxID=523841 RepID=I3R4P3_HALMT|nr:hypothetical protein [Haloferax mediterranei]AFK19203.1 hypothetical protein HFX_1495 [Haloferax mediterranei ATCC 33500]AHZ21433.1 hypothetical protein BM92_01660 [Haloferax mediterranei ATCC 33500]EMA03891.1 hypothetical protein C439_02998 [Haloferax mediterranei ATCC 33500]MDX5989305.1 hypothetical protein [Haloferax mediterranei ATCC 33500]QCQ75673.1 hypothetical protein E6P09_10510 [Haloferax mediterranei ATCC 33500]